MFHADRETDGQTDMMKITVAFRNFAIAPKNVFHPAGISNVIPLQSSMKLSRHTDWLSIPLVCLWDYIHDVQIFKLLTDC